MDTGESSMALPSSEPQLQSALPDPDSSGLQKASAGSSPDTSSDEVSKSLQAPTYTLPATPLLVAAPN